MDEFNLDDLLTSEPLDTKPAESISSSEVSKSSNSSSGSKEPWKKEKEKKPSLYKNKDLEPTKIDPTKFQKEPTKQFVVFDNGNVPAEKLEFLKQVLAKLFAKGYIARSPGNDKQVVDKTIRELPGSKVEIYIPWSKFKADTSGFKIASDTNTQKSYEVAYAYHKNFINLKDFLRAIYALRVQLLLGKECDAPVDFILTYTDCGATSFKDKGFKIETARDVWFPMKIAKDADIPIFNINNPSFAKDFAEFINATNKPITDPMANL